jgi:hypothetical protein
MEKDMRTPMTNVLKTAPKAAPVLVALSLLAGLGCQPSRSTGTPTSLADLVKTRINVRARPAVAAARGRVALPPGVDVELDFEDAGAMDESGTRCPVLRNDAGATVDGRGATFIERGGPVGQGRASVEYYTCRPVRFVAPVDAPFDRRIVIAVSDRSRTFHVEVDNLFDAAGAVLPTSGDARRARVVTCAGGLLCNTDPAPSFALDFER